MDSGHPKGWQLPWGGFKTSSEKLHGCSEQPVCVSPASFGPHLNPPSRYSLQDRGVYLAASLPVTPWPYSPRGGGEAGQGGCLSSWPACETVLPAHIKVTNLHGCYSETTTDSCFNSYFGQ